MTTKVTKTCDVFVSHAAADSQLASEIAARLESAGLQTFHTGMIKPGSDVGDAIWQALAESRALLAIISPDVLPHAMGLVEIGAAAAWNKPVFLLMTGPPSTELPPSISAYPVYPIGRLDEVIQEIRRGIRPLSDVERTFLGDIYCNVGTPADQLSQTPQALRELTNRFNRRAGKQLSGERLLSELLRMRKKGQLPRMRSRPVRETTH